MGYPVTSDKDSGENQGDKGRPMKMLDCFSGYGGFTIAGDSLGIETVGFFEVDKYASSVLTFNYPRIHNYGDINNWREQEIPDFDLLCGGSPCQDFSIAGTRDGLDGGRSGLFFRFVEIAKAYTPKYIIWENVLGTLSATKGWDFATILTEMASAGYDIQWGVVNAKWFVPQNRERLFVVGHLRGTPRREVFPIEGNDREVRKVGRDISLCVDANYWKGPSPSGVKKMKRQLIQVGNVDTKGHNSLWGRVYDPEGLAVTLKAEGGGTGAKTGLYRVALTERRTKEAREARRKSMQETGRDWSPRRGKELVPRTDGLGNCLTTGHTKEHLLLEEDFRIRKLTPVECERLMGLEDGWTEFGQDGEWTVDISNTQRYKLCGNGVVPQVVREIMKRMIAYAKQERPRGGGETIFTGG
jgi:DNA (cytosine-5)-methyltransferase 1